MIIAWKAWFVTVPMQEAPLSYTSDDCDWAELPNDGCLGVVLFEDSKKPDGYRNRTILSTYDYYFKSGNVYGSDNDVRERNVQQEIKDRYVDPVIIRGIWTDEETMHEVQQQMRNAEWQ